GGSGYATALQVQADKLTDVEKTPSARLIHALRESGLSLHAYTLAQSEAQCRALREASLSGERLSYYHEAARASLDEQVEIENSDTESFDDYVARYHAALNFPGTPAN